jgi:predicted TIM-barrel fold metal-dependent hydrolase
VNTVSSPQRPDVIAPASITVVDTDVHPVPRSKDQLYEYYDEPWRSLEFGPRVRPIDNNPRIAQTPNDGVRLDAIPPSGPAGSDPLFAATQLREMGNIEYAILIPIASVRPREDPEREAAGCRATNRWMADTWLSKENHHDIFRGSLRVAIDDPRLAVAEIELWAGHAGFVQVAASPLTRVPLGDPSFDPVYEAASRHGLPFTIHPIASLGTRVLTPVGFPTYFSEFHSEMALIGVAHLISLIFNGTFERIPALRCVIVEAGVAWLTPLIWKMDRHWREFQSEYPALRRPPSQVVAEHVRFSTQPLESPARTRDMVDMIELAGIERALMFSSDYPHHDTDDPAWAISHFPEHLRERIMSTNALEFYGLQVRNSISPNA